MQRFEVVNLSTHRPIATIVEVAFGEEPLNQGIEFFTLSGIEKGLTSRGYGNITRGVDGKGVIGVGLPAWGFYAVLDVRQRLERGNNLGSNRIGESVDLGKEVIWGVELAVIEDSVE